MGPSHSSILLASCLLVASQKTTVLADRPPAHLSFVEGEIWLAKPDPALCQFSIRMVDGTGAVFSRQTIENRGTFPYQFRLDYDPKQIRAGWRYRIAVEAIRHGLPPIESTMDVEFGAHHRLELGADAVRDSAAGQPRAQRRTRVAFEEDYEEPQPAARPLQLAVSSRGLPPEPVLTMPDSTAAARIQPPPTLTELPQAAPPRTAASKPDGAGWRSSWKPAWRFMGRAASKTKRLWKPGDSASSDK